MTVERRKLLDSWLGDENLMFKAYDANPDFKKFEEIFWFRGKNGEEFIPKRYDGLHQELQVYAKRDDSEDEVDTAPTRPLTKEVQQRLDLLEKWNKDHDQMYKDIKHLKLNETRFYFKKGELPDEMFDTPPKGDDNGTPTKFKDLERLFKKYHKDIQDQAQKLARMREAYQNRYGNETPKQRYERLLSWKHNPRAMQHYAEIEDIYENGDIFYFEKGQLKDDLFDNLLEEDQTDVPTALREIYERYVDLQNTLRRRTPTPSPHGAGSAKPSPHGAGSAKPSPHVVESAKPKPSQPKPSNSPTAPQKPIKSSSASQKPSSAKKSKTASAKPRCDPVVNDSPKKGDKVAVKKIPVETPARKASSSRASEKTPIKETPPKRTSIRKASLNTPSNRSSSKDTQPNPPARKAPSNRSSSSSKNTPSKKTQARKAPSKRGNGEKKPMNAKARAALKEYQEFASDNRQQIKDLVKAYVYTNGENRKVKLGKHMISPVSRAILSYLWKSKTSFDDWDSSEQAETGLPVSSFIQTVQEDSIQRHKDARELLRRYGVRKNKVVENILLRLSNRKSKFSRLTPKLQNKINEVLEKNRPPLPTVKFEAPLPRVKQDMITDAKQLVFDELGYEEGPQQTRAATIIAQNASVGCRFKRLTPKMKKALIDEMNLDPSVFDKQKEPKKSKEPKQPKNPKTKAKASTKKVVSHNNREEVRDISNRFSRIKERFGNWIKGANLTKKQKKDFTDALTQAGQVLTTVPTTPAELHQRHRSIEDITEKLIAAAQSMGALSSSSEARAPPRKNSSKKGSSRKSSAKKPQVNQASIAKQLAMVKSRANEMKEVAPEIKGMLELVGNLMQQNEVMQQQLNDLNARSQGSKRKKSQG